MMIIPQKRPRVLAYCIKLLPIKLLSSSFISAPLLTLRLRDIMSMTLSSSMLLGDFTFLWYHFYWVLNDEFSARYASGFSDGVVCPSQPLDTNFDGQANYETDFHVPQAHFDHIMRLDILCSIHSVN